MSMKFGPVLPIQSTKLAAERGLMLRVRKPGREVAGGRQYLRVTCEDGPVRLGRWGAEEAEARYWHGVARWVATGCEAPFTRSLFEIPEEAAAEDDGTPPTVDAVEGTIGDLADRYLEWFVSTRVREDRDYESTIRLHSTVLDRLVEFFTPKSRGRGRWTPVSAIRSRTLHEFRDWLIAGYRTAAGEAEADRERRRASDAGVEPDPAKLPQPRARSTVNAYTKALRRIIRWAYRQEIAGRDELDAVNTMDALRARQSQAREPRRRMPVPDEILLATCEHLPETYAVMAKIQRLSGVRPGEIIALTADQVDTTPDASGNWTVTQVEHKTDYAEGGEPRVWWLNEEAQELIRDRLIRCRPGDRVFTSRDAHRDRLRAAGADRDLSEAELRKFPDFIPEDAYRKAVARACEAAGVPKWTPHQLRHTAATTIRASSTADEAQAALGHGDLRTTERYARVDRAKGSRAIASVSLAG